MTKYPIPGWCETNSNQSQYAVDDVNLCRTKLPPVGGSNTSVEVKIFSAVKRAFLIEIVVTYRVGSGELL